MDRRKSLKLIVTGAVAVPAAIAGCKSSTPDKEVVEAPAFNLDRNPEELKYEKSLIDQEAFFTPHEMATITILADLIIPRDAVSGSASDAKVPEFIEFIVKDMPQHQVPMRGGLRWMDMQCLKRFNAAFKDCTVAQQKELLDLVAYPDRAKDKPELNPGVSFFSLMRNLTASGFYTSKIGVADIGYEGNKPNQWKGVPQEVLDQYKMTYTEKEIRETVA